MRRWEGLEVATKRELQKQWEAVNNSLADLYDLRVWPGNQDIAEVEGELLEELDEIEHGSTADKERASH